MCSVPSPGLSSSGDQVLGERAVPDGLCILITSPALALGFLDALGEYRLRCLMSPLETWSQVVTLLADVNHIGSQEDMVSSWEPAHSLVEDVAAPCLLTLVVTSLPLCLWAGRGQYTAASSPFVFLQSFVLWVGQVMRLEPFAESFLFHSCS